MSCCRARAGLPAGGRHFTVLIVDLERDNDNNSQSAHVAAALAPYRGLDVVRIGPGPKGDLGSRSRFEERARSLLKKKHGDVLVLGEIAVAGCAETLA